MSNRSVWFSDEPSAPTTAWRWWSWIKSKLIYIGIFIGNAVDPMIGAFMSHRYAAELATHSQDMSDTQTVASEARAETQTAPVAPVTNITQHFYLRLKRDGTERAPEHDTHPVGVIAMTFGDDNKFVVSGTIVSRKDVFTKKQGVSRALGRLKSYDESVELTEETLKGIQASQLAAELGLYTKKANYFGSIDWDRATKTLGTAVQLLKDRSQRGAVAA